MVIFNCWIDASRCKCSVCYLPAGCSDHGSEFADIRDVVPWLIIRPYPMLALRRTILAKLCTVLTLFQTVFGCARVLGFTPHSPPVKKLLVFPSFYRWED